MIVFCCVLPASNKARDDDDDDEQEVIVFARVTLPWHGVVARAGSVSVFGIFVGIFHVGSVSGIGISDVNLLISGHMGISVCAITVRNN